MGYSASLIQQTGPISIPVTKVPAILADLAREQETANVFGTQTKGGGHLSWCDRVENYSQDRDGLVKLLTDYGFDDFDTEADPDHIQIHSWGGDKIGSCWDTFWAILGEHADEHVTWTVLGEDGEVWAERIDGTGWHTLGVSLSVKEEG